MTLQNFTAENLGDGIQLRWRFEDPSEVATLAVERALTAAGPWAPQPTEVSQDGAMTIALDTHVEPGVTYFYRLRLTSGHIRQPLYRRDIAYL